jgi:PAS domain S-box-containing protein
MTKIPRAVQPGVAQYQFLDALLDSAPDGLLVVDPAGTIRLVNSKMETMLGYSREELLGKPFDTLIPVRYRAKHTGHAREFFATPRSRPMQSGTELSALCKNGAEVPVEISLSPMRTDGVVLVVAALRDLRERLRAEEERRESEARYRLLFENSLDGILLTLPDGSVLDANPSACRIMGRTREEIVQAGRAGIVDATDPRLAVLIEERTRTGKAQGELNCRRPDGTFFPIEISSVVFQGFGGESRTVIIFRDVSARKTAETEREQLVSELQEALQRVKVLSGLLPICASCKKIRDAEGTWHHLETYITKHSDATFTHGICADCRRKLYPDLHS